MFDPNNHNLSVEESQTANDLNEVVEALADGLDLGDAAPAYAAFRDITARLKGKTKTEIRRHLAKAAVAQVFDELTEEGHL